MLQIRLSKAPASDGSAGVKLSPVETVTVACPDHLVLADLPVAKGIGTATAASVVKTLGRRSRRQLGERVHFCVCCDFPIAIFGRLSPCDHAFCLDCARSDSLCYLCDERIQKIQTIKMMEGILICAAPHCLKSFMKRADFESHIHENHGDLLRPNADKEDGNESEAQSVRQPAASDSTARGPQRSVFSPRSNSQHDLEDRTRRPPPREHAHSRSNMQSKPPYFGQHHHPSDTMSGSVGGIQQGFHQQTFDMQHPPQEHSQFADRQQSVGPESSFPEYQTMHPSQPPNTPSLVTSNPMMNLPMPFGYPPYPHERAQPFYPAPYDMPRQDSASDISGDQNSLMGFPQGGPSGPNFPGNYPQPWHGGIAGVPFEQGQGGGMVVDPRDTKGVLAPQPMPLPPPPPPPPPHMSHLKQNYYSGEHGQDGQGYGWQHDNRDSFGGQGQ